ncbi:MAG: arsenic resistance N-acetyltransferase ArsN2 [Nitrospirota bacterium]
MLHRIIRFADSTDVESITQLLIEAGLPARGVSDYFNHFLVAKSGKTLVGVVGLEPYGAFGLLRSLAVAPAHRGQGLGRRLYERMLAYAHLRGIEALYLLTTTVEGFFSTLGFEIVDRHRLPTPIRATEEFQGLCPSSAVCMMKRIDHEAHYYPKEILRLEPDVPGARMWGISLHKAMLTYFEAEPNCRFERHRHESEQITMVLQGSLFFELEDGRIVEVREGDVIAIPSNLSHAVHTGKKKARAVDAWSPVMEKYKKQG